MTKKVVRLKKRLNRGVQRAIEIAGGQSELARKLDVEQPAVFHWLNFSCPPERAVAIEKATGVPRGEICPKIFS